MTPHPFGRGLNFHCATELATFLSMSVLLQPEVERGRPPLVSILPLQAHCSSTTSVRLNFRIARRLDIITCLVPFNGPFHPIERLINLAEAKMAPGKTGR